MHTNRLRLEIVSDGTHSTGILEWQVVSSGPVPSFPPTVDAGIDRKVVIGGETYLMGKVEWLKPGRSNTARWSKESGPGHVLLADATAPVTTAAFSAPGEYVLKLTASGDNQQASSTLTVKAETAPPKDRLERGLHQNVRHRQPALECARQGAHRQLDSPLHCQCERTGPDRRDRAASTISSRRQRRCAASPTPATRATFFRTHGFTRPSSPCASR